MNIKKYLTAGTFLLLIFGFFIANLFYTPPIVSKSERRTLATFQAPTWKSVWNTKFMNHFDSDYSLDSFIFRDELRSIKANFQRGVLLLKDANDIYIEEGYAAKLEEMSENSVKSAANKINRVIESLPEGLNYYYSIIPDKSYFLAEKHGYPSMDYSLLVSMMNEGVMKAEYIDIFDSLSVSDYYRTDLHWAQESILPVAQALGEAMGFADRLETEFVKHELYPFYGVYCGQSALSLKPDTLTYLTSDTTDNAIVQIFDAKTMSFVDAEMYETDSFNGIDPYDVYLSGAELLITITNPNAATDKELYIYRDSFSSSLSPLLIAAYSKITLIDLRYVASSLAAQYVDFKEGSDVLFLYGTLVLNSSGTLLVG